MNRTRLTAMLVKDEDRRSHAYDDATGKTLKTGDTLQGILTIGVGYNLQERGLPPDIVELLFDRALTEAIQQCIDHIDGFRVLDEVRQHVLVNMCFNLGLTRLKKFEKMFAAIERRDWNAAAAEMLDSRWAKQVGSRAVELARMMRTGEP